MNLMRSHPLNILEKTSKFLILLLLPLMRALWSAFWDANLNAWLRGAWFDIVVLAVILGLGIYSWYSYVFAFTADGIFIRKGIFFRQQRFLAFKSITAVSISYPWYYSPLHVVRLNADTDGGSTRSSDFFITIKKDAAEALYNASKIPFSNTNSLKRFYIPSNTSIAIFSFLTSNSIAGVIYFAASVSQLGNFFGQDIEDKLFDSFAKIMHKVAFGLPPMAAAVGYAILGFWAISFIMNLVKHLRFSVARRAKILDVRAGIFTRRRFSITIDRINVLTIRQSLMTKFFGLFSVFIYCTGYGKTGDEQSVLMPSGLAKDINANLEMLLPEIKQAPRQIHPRLANLSRFLFPPVMLILGIIAAVLVGCYFIRSFTSTIIAFGVICGIPSIWWLIVKFYSFLTTGIGVNNDVITLYYTFGFKILTSTIPRNKLSKIEFYQSLFQITTKCCDLTFCTYGEGRRRQRVVNMHIPQAEELLGITFDKRKWLPNFLKKMKKHR